MLADDGGPAAVARLAALFLVADEAFFSVDLGSGSLTVSRGFEVAFGHRASEVGSAIEAWSDLVHPADLPAFTEATRSAMASGAELVEHELRLRLVDGTYTLVRCRIAIVRDPSGTATWLIGAVSDMSARASEVVEMQSRTRELLEATAEAREEEARHRRVESAVDEALWEWDIASGSVEYSGAIRRLFGYEPADIRPTYTWREERLHPDDAAGVRHSVAMHLAGDLSEWVGIYRFRRADGSYAWVRDHAYLERSAGEPRWMVGSMRLIAEPTGSAVSRGLNDVRLSPRQAEILGLIQEGLTNKQIAARVGIGEQSVKDHVSRLLSRFKAANRAALVAATGPVEIRRGERDDPLASSESVPPLFTVMRGPDHVIVGASPEVLRLTPGREPIGKPLRAAYPELAGQGVFELFDVVYGSGEPMRSERFVVLLRSAGLVVTVVVDLHLEPIRDVRGAVDGVLAYGIDVSRRQKDGAGLETGLRRQMQALADLPIGAVLTDATGTITTMNERARKILGPAISDGRPTPDHAHEYRLRDADTRRALGRTETAVARALRGEIISRVDYLLRPPGAERDVLLRTSALPIFGPDGVVAVLLTFLEVDTR